MKAMVVCSALLHCIAGVLFAAGQVVTLPKESANEIYFKSAQTEIKTWEARDEQEASESSFGYLAGAIHTVKEDLYWCGMDWKTEKFDGDVEKLKLDWAIMQKVDLQIRTYRFS